MIISIEDVTVVVESKELCFGTENLARIVIQEFGIPGPIGPAGDLATTNFQAPLAYDVPSTTLFISPTPSVDQVYRWSGATWEPVTLPDRFVEVREVSPAEAMAKEITLLNPVTDASKIVFDIDGAGAPQFLGIDYQLMGSVTLSWNGFQLEGLIEAGDRLRISYE